MRDFDVVVVGGGCSGLWAARVAAMKGAATLLVERTARIGERVVCAEGIGAAGISQLLDLHPDWIATPVNGAKLCSPGGETVEFREPGCGFILHKDVFVRGLCRMVAEDGVEIRLASRVAGVKILPKGGIELSIEGPDRSYTLISGAVVAADGIEASVARMAGIGRFFKASEVFSCAQYTVAPIDVDPNVVEFHIGRKIAPGGYAWVFPKGNCTANVGVGIVPKATDGASPWDYLRVFKEKRCPRARTLGFVVGGVPSVREPHKASRAGIFVAGDAAAVADPISGAGIVPGMESAAIAAESACLYAGGALESHVIEREFAARLKSLFEDRNLRYAVRKVLSRMDDKELAGLISAAASYAAQGSSIKSDPFELLRFVVKAMPTTFGFMKRMVGI